MASIRKRGEKWQARVQMRGMPPLSKTFTSKADAVRWSRKTEIELERGEFVRRVTEDRHLLHDALERYCQEITPSKKGATVEVYRIAVLKRSPLAKQALATIRSPDIARYRDQRGKEVSANTVKNELNTLSAVFEVCRLEWGINVPNPVRGLKRPKAPKGRERRLHPSEEERLLAACKKSRAWYLYGAVIVAIETGMRLGELAGLMWERIDLQQQIAHLADTKNGSARSVPLSTRALQALNALPRSLTGKVFPVHVDTIKQAFRSAVARGRKAYERELADAGAVHDTSKLPPILTDLRFHDLRHEAVSRLFERGFNPMEVAAISGHKTLAMLKRYTHLRAEDLALRLG